MMVDPAVAYQDYAAFNDGKDIFMKTSNGSVFAGVVWPGITAWPDFFNPGSQIYWNHHFCNYPCKDPGGFAKENDFPPKPPPVRNGSAIVLEGFPAGFQPPSQRKRQESSLGKHMVLSGRELIDPPYKIRNAAGGLSNKTLDTELVHDNGLVEYDTHNLYGMMMSSASREALLQRRPGERPLVITRSTFLGAGRHVGHWCGDNVASWAQYEISISSMLNFPSVFQTPMVGSDVCGFSGNTTETLCARWMMLGAFQSFYPNYNELGSIGQEAYRWPTVAEAARRAIDIRYHLLDYLYTAFYVQTQIGKQALKPLFYLYATDKETFGIDSQFFYGDGILVSPVTEENSTSVDVYLLDHIFYDWNGDFSPVRGSGATIRLSDIDSTTIPLHVRGGNILPLRMESANTTAAVRAKGFHILVAPGLDGQTKGSHYMDDGVSIEQPRTTFINFTYNNGSFTMSGEYDYGANVSIERISVLGVSSEPQSVNLTGLSSTFTFNGTTQVVTIDTSLPLTADARFQLPASQADRASPANNTTPPQGGSEGQGGGQSSGGSGGESSAAVARSLISIKVSAALIVVILILDM
ncbi:alpha-glucosidase [Exophiala aquamarina CBS 119918]|uniref:alpha-glucosidase n=1 Tax=Exophiala aquamarina CBS 119918 TaxID=1182545 RepID=A0A072PW47_9EURO|nr:alpha-glucosidase [Exophiala aquamarina CBS 119918]KEF59765.1 alpha-glucosidase [Exophiala aquamarina CBS 119918]